MLPLLSCYIACLTIAILCRDAGKVATAAALFTNWIFCTGIVSATGDVYPWLAFIVADYLTALGIYGWTVSRWQSAIIAIYGLQIICHSAFGYSAQGAWAHYRGWWTLYYLAVAQVVMFGGWIVADAVGHRRGIGRSVSPALAGATQGQEP